MNNISRIIKFVNGEIEPVLIINQVNETISMFYLNLIERIMTEKNIKLNYNAKPLKNLSRDLFVKSEINICFSNDKKNIEQHIKSNNKCIIFTDYKNFKTYSISKSSINGYQYLKDIEYYIKEILKINNSAIIDFCKENPHLTISEISKYLINSLSYVKENKIREKNNFILEIRKELFNLKKDQKGSLEIYSNLKREVKYKKFNFLTY